MTELSILLHPDVRLKKVSSPVTNIDETIKKLCLDMIDTMYKYSGVGLAAPQVGVLKRVVVMDCSELDKKNPKILINPELIWSSEEKFVFEEGCLSIPEIREKITRPAEVKVKFTNIDGSLYEDNGDEVVILPGMIADIDVLSGKRTILDYFWQPISRTKEKAFRE